MSDLALGINVAGVADAIAALQRIGTAIGGTASQTRAATQSNADQARSQDAASTSALAFGQRMAGVANAVQNLTSRMGSRDTTAGLIGSVISTTTQFAQMGAALGPQGALAGGLAGIAVSMVELSQSETTAAEHTRALAAAHAELGRQVQETTSTIAAELVADEALYREHADNVASFWNTITGNTGRAIRQLRDDRAQIERDEARLREQQDAGPDGLGGLHGPSGPQFGRLATADQVTALTGRGDTGSPTRRGGGTTRDARADEQTASVRSLIDSLSESEADVAQFGEQLATLEQEFGSVWAAAYDGSSTYLEQQAHLIEGVRELQTAEQAAHETRATAAQHDIDDVTRVAEAKRAAREQDDLDAAKLSETTALRHKTLDQQLREEEQTKRKAAQQQQERVSMTQQATGQMIGELTNVFTLIGEGQATAAQGAELLLASFLQYISQRATIEALAQVAQAIGSYPDPAGMALHAAAAVAWGAVAVATGVGANALNADVQGQMNAAHPGATSHDTTSASRERDSQPKGGGDAHFYIYPGGYITKADVGAGMVQGLREAARQGFLIPQSALERP